MRLLAYLVRRLLGMLAVLAGVAVITFVISHVIPADPAVVALGDHATDDQITAFRAEYGLDKPLVEQFGRYVNGLLHGDLGRSIRTRRPVADDLREFFPATLELSLAALFVSVLVGIPAGTWSAVRRSRLPDHLVRLFSLIGGALPIFWLGLLLIGLFYSRLGWLPSGGRIDQFMDPPRRLTGLYLIDSLLTGNMPAFQSSLHHLLLPAVTLGYYSTAVIARMMRSSMLEVLRQDYMLLARAKGNRESRAIVRHGMRTALIPTLTVLGVAFGSLLSGAVLTETIFTWPGLGRYATASAISLDFPAVMGVTLLAAVVYPLANLLVDLAYHWLDPRIQNA